MSALVPTTVRRDERLLRQHHRRVALVVAGVVVIAAIAASDPLHHAALSLIKAAEAIIGRHTVAGAVIYVLLSAASAMVVFFSTAIFTPIAVDAFGTVPAMLLLWLGWVLGGVFAYGTGRYFGRPVVGWFVDPARLHDYEARAAKLISFRHVLLFQLSVPSEIPGYVLGLAGCPFWMFVTGMSIAEFPFAVGAVYLGESFLQRNYPLLLALGAGGILVMWVAYRGAAAIWSRDPAS